MSFRPELSDARWWLYFSLHALIAFVGAKTLVEEATGNKRELLLLYLLLVTLAYPALLPLPQAMMRQAAHPHNTKWWCAWRWTLADTRAMPSSEVKFLAMTTPVAVGWITYTILDAYIFLNPERSVDAAMLTFGRPLVTYAVRRVFTSLFYHVLQTSASVHAQTYRELAIQIGLACPNVRLATSCA
jgi:hypothetical protein